MFKLAFVNFFKEKRGRRVVKVKDIKDFEPTHHADFSEHNTYEVSWPHLPNEGSFSTESLFEAKILCIGVSEEDLEHEAKSKGLKIPKVVPIQTDEKPADVKKSKRGRKLVEPKLIAAASSSAHVPDSHMKKKKKATPEDKTRGKRHVKVLDNYDDLFSPDEVTPQVVRSSLTKAASPAKKKSINVLKSVSPRKNRGSESEDLAKEKSVRVKSVSPFKSATPMQQVVRSSSTKAVSPAKKKSVNVLKSFLPDKNGGSESTASLAKKKSVSLGKSVSPFKSATPIQQVVRSFLTKEAASPAKKKFVSVLQSRSPNKDGGSSEALTDSNSPLKLWSDSSFKKPASPNYSDSDLHEDKNSGLLPLVVSPQKNEASFCLPNPEVNTSKTSYALRPNVKKAKNSDDDSTTSVSDSYIESDAERELYRHKTLSLESSSKKLQGENRRLLEELRTCKEEIVALKEKLTKYTELNMKLTDKLLSQNPISLHLFCDEEVAEIQASSPPSSPTKEVPHAIEPKRRLDFDNDENQDISVVSNGEKESRKKRKVVDDREENVTSNEELAGMIVEALRSKSHLQSDGAGKVHLGNGVWISQKLWEEKLKKSTVSPSIALRDAMEKIYSKEEMAQRSLEGGTPVKPSAQGLKKKKMKMTPNKREAILGLFRAKTVMATGSQDKHFLDLAVKGGKGTIRDKLKEAAKGLDKEKMKQ